GRYLQVARDAVDRAQRLDAVAHERRAPHRRRHLPVLDQVALGDAEHEVAGGGLDLSAAERDGVQAALHAADQVVARGLARREERVRHARDRELPEGFAAAVAGGLDAVLARPEQVVQVRGEPSVLDDGGAASGRALVVDPLAPPRVGPAAVVVRRDEVGRQLLAQAAGVDACVLLDGVRLEAVTDRLVEQDSAEAVPYHHRQPPGRGVHRVQQRERPARGVLRHLLRTLLDQLPPRVAAARVRAGLDSAVPPSHDLRAQADARAVVARRAPVGPVHLDLAPVLRVADARLRDLGTGGAGV